MHKAVHNPVDNIPYPVCAHTIPRMVYTYTRRGIFTDRPVRGAQHRAKGMGASTPKNGLNRAIKMIVCKCSLRSFLTLDFIRVIWGLRMPQPENIH